MLYPHVFNNKLGTDFRWLDLPVQWLVTMHAELLAKLILRNKLLILKKKKAFG